MTNDFVSRFRMGEEIPEWLLTVEPRPDVPTSSRGNFRFAVDADVIDTDAGYVVIPRTPGDFQGVFDMSGISGCKVFPPGKMVSVALCLQHYFTPETTNAWVPMGNNGQLMPPPQALPMQPLGGGPAYGQNPIIKEHLRREGALFADEVERRTLENFKLLPDPHPTFWARLCYAFTGRL